MSTCKKGVSGIMNSFYFLSLINSFNLIRGTKTFGIHSSLFQERNQFKSCFKLLWSQLLFLARQSQVFTMREKKKPIKTKTTKSTTWSNPSSKTLIRNYFLIMLRGYIHIMFKIQILLMAQSLGSTSHWSCITRGLKAYVGSIFLSQVGWCEPRMHRL